jgi:hypothetical protein
MPNGDAYQVGFRSCSRTVWDGQWGRWGLISDILDYVTQMRRDSSKFPVQPLVNDLHRKLVEEKLV